MAVPKNKQGNSRNIYGYDKISKIWSAFQVNSSTGGLITSSEIEGKKIEVDVLSSGVTYYGFAEPGTATSAASWRIMKMDESSAPDWSLTHADGNTDYDNVWDDRATLSYS